VDWDEELYYEAALDIIASLMAWCTAAEARDPTAAERRRGHLAESRDLDPADHEAVARAIRTHGARLADLVASAEIPPPPGEYRLTAEEHAQVFEERIGPETSLGRETAEPTVVIVAGEPGSGTTTQVRRQARARGDCALIDPDEFLPYHPHSWDLVLRDDPAAADQVMSDALGWCVLAVDRAIARRSDVVLAVRVSEDLEDYAAIFQDAGYRVETEIMAVPEAVQKLTVMIRQQCRRGNWKVLTLP
jgi:hypothetical protein